MICGEIVSAQIDQSETYIQKSQEAYELEDYEIALVAIDSAIYLAPDIAGLYDFKSDILINLKKFDYAGEILDFAVSKFPNDPYTYCKRGHYKLYIGRPTEALDNYGTALSIVENDSLEFEIKTYIAVTKQELRDFEGAKNDLLELYKIDALNLNTLLSLGNLEDELNNKDIALEYYNKIIEIDSNHVRTLMNIGYLLQQQEKYLESFEYYERAFKIDTFIEHLYYSNQAINLLYLKKENEALEFINKSLSINPYNAYAHRNKALILKDLSRVDEACIALNEALKYNFTKIYGEEVINLINENCK